VKPGFNGCESACLRRGSIVRVMPCEHLDEKEGMCAVLLELPWSMNCMESWVLQEVMASIANKRSSLWRP
jgi:hypothetical protein